MNDDDKEHNLVRLCSRLMNETTTPQLAEICREIGFDPDAGGVPFAGPLIPPLAVYLVHSLYQAGKLGEFLTACKRHHIELGDNVIEFPLDTSLWEPCALSPDVVNLMNERLGMRGHPHVVRDWDDEQRLNETGCMCWDAFHGARDSEIINTERVRILDEVRGWLDGVDAFAYIGEYLVPYPPNPPSVTGLIQIVVAPTTDPLDAIRIEQTRNDNEDVDTPSLLDEMEHIGRKFKIDIFGVTEQVVAFRVKFKSAEEKAALKAWLESYAHNGYDMEEHHWFGSADPDLFAIRLWWD